MKITKVNISKRRKIKYQLRLLKNKGNIYTMANNNMWFQWEDNIRGFSIRYRNFQNDNWSKW